MFLLPVLMVPGVAWLAAREGRLRTGQLPGVLAASFLLGQGVFALLALAGQSLSATGWPIVLLPLFICVLGMAFSFQRAWRARWVTSVALTVLSLPVAWGLTGLLGLLSVGRSLDQWRDPILVLPVIGLALVWMAQELCARVFPGLHWAAWVVVHLLASLGALLTALWASLVVLS